MITAVSKGRAVWRRELRGAVLTVIEFPPVPERAAVFELFTLGAGRVGSLGKFPSRAAALRCALDGGGHRV